MIEPTIRPLSQSQGDKTREPEDGRHSVGGQNHKLVSHVPAIGVVVRGDHHEDDGEDGPGC